MRELILKRIEEIRKSQNDFSKSNSKWKNFSNGTVKGHISDINFTECNDVELLFLFERIIKRLNTVC